MKKNNKKAFTLVELVIVIAVIAILAAVLIPTFSNIIKNSKNSADESELSAINVELAVFESDEHQKEITTEADIYGVIASVYGESKAKAFYPRNADDGLHFWYDTTTNTIVLKQYEDLSNAVGAAQSSEDTESAFKKENKASFKLFKDRYYFLDNEGSDVARAINSLSNPENADSFGTHVSAVENIKDRDDDKALATAFLDRLNKIAIVTNKATYVRSADLVEKFYFLGNVETISSNVISDKGYVAKAENVKDGEITLPSTVTKIEEKALWFDNAGVRLVSDSFVSTDAVKSIFDANATNATIVVNVGETETGYSINENKLMQGETVVDSLKYTYPVEDFDIVCDSASSEPGEGSIYVNNNYVYVAAGVDTFQLSANIHNENASSKDFIWEIEENGFVSINSANGACEITSVPEHTQDANYSFTVTATPVAGGDAKTVEIYIVRPTQAQLTFANNELTILSTPVSEEYRQTIYWEYNGENTNTDSFSFTEISLAVNKSDVVVFNGASYSYELTGTMFTVSGSTVTLDPTKISADVQTLTIKYVIGSNVYLQETFNVEVVDNSAKPFTTKSVNGTQIGTKYIYRIGNENSFTLGGIFESEKTPENVTVKIFDANAITGTGSPSESDLIYTAEKEYFRANANTFNLDKENWDDTEIRFYGTGIADIWIGNDMVGYAKLRVEVVDGKNFANNATINGSYSSNIVLLGNATVGSSTISLTGASLYGNGYTFDVSSGPTANKNLSDNYLVKLKNSILDNVKITGKQYTSFGSGATEGENNRPTVLISGDSKNGDRSCIYNSYITNCASPVRAMGGEIVISKTTLQGGSLANLDIRAGNITLEDVITINQVTGFESSIEKGALGLGILVWHENVASSTKLTITGALTQYNCISETQANDYMVNEASYLIDVLYDNGLSSVRYDANGEKWANTGIMSASTDFTASNVTFDDSIGYVGQTATVKISGIISREGYYWTKQPTSANYENTPSTWTPNEQSEIAPTFDFNHENEENYQAKAEGSNDYCYYDSNTNSVSISFDEGDTKTYNPNILSATKHGNDLAYTVTIDGVDYTNKTIEFSANGEHVVEYTYTDSYNFAIVDGAVVKTDEEYTKSFTIVVTVVKAEAKDPKFTFYGYSGISKTAANTYESTTAVDTAGNTWVMPSTSDGNVVTKKFNGLNVKAPKVYVDFKDNSSDFNWLYPYFTGVTIEDYANGGTAETAHIVANSSTSAKPSNFARISTDATLDQGASTEQNKCTEEKISQGTYKGLYGFTSCPKGADTTESTIYAEFSYKSEKGDTYYYCIAFVRQAHTCPTSCFTPDTLITLADGTQKRIDEVNPDDIILAWDFFTGSYVEKKISLLVNHGEDIYSITNLEFSDGTVLKLIGEHGVFDYDLNKFVYFNTENYADFYGHKFVKQNAEGGYELVTLVNAFVTEEYTSAWSISSAVTSNAFASKMLTVAPPEDFYNWIEMSDKMVYDAEKFYKEIEEYGLYTYDDFAEYVTYEQFVEWNGAYLKVAVEKGYFTFDYIIELIELYKGWMP